MTISCVLSLHLAKIDALGSMQVAFQEARENEACALQCYWFIWHEPSFSVLRAVDSHITGDEQFCLFLQDQPPPPDGSVFGSWLKNNCLQLILGQEQVVLVGRGKHFAGSDPWLVSWMHTAQEYWCWALILQFLQVIPSFVWAGQETPSHPSGWWPEQMLFIPLSLFLWTTVM